MLICPLALNTKHQENRIAPQKRSFGKVQFLFEAVFILTLLVFLFSEHDLGEDDIYDCVPCDDDGDDIYEDIIKVEVRQPMVRSLY